MKLFIFFIVDLFVLILSAVISKGEDIFMLTGVVSMLAIPVFIIIFIFKGVKFLFKKIKTFEIKTHDNSNNKVENQIIKEQEKTMREQAERRNKSKYQDYNYSYDLPGKDIKELNIETYRKENQGDYLSKLKMDFIEEEGVKPDFEKLKHSIFACNEDDFDCHQDYLVNGEREYFLKNNKWCFFDFDDETMQYKFIVCDNKIFYTDCYIGKMTNKTKKLLKYIQQNPNKQVFYEADLKNQDKILKTGIKIQCDNCYYTYYSDNKKCPNCGYLTKDTLQ